MAEQPTGSRKKTLFDELLMGNFLVLHYDALERPDLYDQPARDLLERLADGQVKLDQLGDTDRAILDLATFEYALSPPVPSHARKREQMVKRVAEKLEPLPTDAASSPEEALPAFWWLR